MYAAILADLKGRYGERVLLSPPDLVDLLGVSVGQQANLRASGKFPVPTKKIGAAVKVSIYDLARYLSGGAETAAAAGVREIAKSEKLDRRAKKAHKGRLEGRWWEFRQVAVFRAIDHSQLLLVDTDLAGACLVPAVSV